jgi:hypothetical protein
MSWDTWAIPQGYHDELFQCIRWLSGCHASVCQLTVHPWPMCFVNSRRHPSVPVDWTTIFIRTTLEIQRWSASRTFSSSFLFTTPAWWNSMQTLFQRQYSHHDCRLFHHIAVLHKAREFVAEPRRLLMGVPSNVTGVTRVRVRCAGFRGRSRLMLLNDVFWRRWQCQRRRYTNV